MATYRMALSRDAASGDGDRLYLDLPGWVTEATDDQRVCWPAFAERFLSSRATGCDVGGIRQDGYELHDVIERHTRSPQLSIEIGPDEAALLLDAAGDVPLGVDADLPADVEHAREAGDLNGLGIGARRRGCVGRVDVAALHRVVSVAVGADR